MMAAGAAPTARICSATTKRCSSLHTTTGAAKSAGSETRRAVSWSIVRPEVKAMNCLGKCGRESGQRRVPAPPDRMTGLMVAIGTSHVGAQHSVRRSQGKTRRADGAGGAPGILI
jgi:hypothetical protein